MRNNEKNIMLITLKNKNFWQAVATLVGYTVGAGILGIPYAVAKVGLVPGLIILLLLGLAALLINLMIMEIMLRTRFRHQLVGLIEKYLGKKMKAVQFLAMIIGGYGALTAYIIGQGEVLAAFFSQPDQRFWYSIIFLLFGVVVLFIGLKIIKIIEFWLVGLIIFVIIIISLISLPAVDLANFSYFDLSKIILPYGVILFAFSGLGAIFSMKEILHNQKHLAKPAIIWGTIIVLAIYALFACVVVGVTGINTTDVATLGLGYHLGYKILVFGNLFAFLAMATSFFTVGISLRQIYHFDYHLPVWLSWLLVIIVPLLVFLFVSQNFILVISIAGSLTFGLSGILIVLTYWRAKKKSDQQPAFSLPRLKIVGWLLILMFIIGIIYTLYNLM